MSPPTVRQPYSSQEEAIAWPAIRRGTMLAASLDSRRLGAAEDQLEPPVLAAVAAGAERAAVLYWARHAQGTATLEDTVRAAVGLALRGVAPAA